MFDHITINAPDLPQERPTSNREERSLRRDEHYDIFRKYLQHEDHLINDRISWNLNIQGFLFATYGFCLQKLIEVNESISEFNFNKPDNMKISLNNISGSQDLEHLIHYVIPAVGLAVGLFSLMGTYAARRAIQRLEEDWKKWVLGVTNLKDEQQCMDAIYKRVPLLPNLTGAGSKGAQGLGFVAPLLIPIGFCLAWASLIFLRIH